MPILPRSGRSTRGAPEKIMLEFRGAGMLEAEHLAALRIDPRHHVRDDTVLAGRIHGLKNQQHRVAIRGIQQLLLGAEFLDMLLEHRLILVIVSVYGLDAGRPFLEIHGAALADTIILGIDAHPHPRGAAMKAVRTPACMSVREIATPRGVSTENPARRLRSSASACPCRPFPTAAVQFAATDRRGGRQPVTELNQRASCLESIAPDWRAISFPPRNTISVGMLRMLKRVAGAGSS